MSTKKRTKEPATKQVPSLSPSDPAIVRAQAEAAQRVFQTACALETLGTLLEDVGSLDDGDTTGAGCLQRILGEGLMEAYGELRFLEEAGQEAAAGGQQ
jgi:hypothetical protein